MTGRLIAFFSSTVGVYLAGAVFLLLLGFGVTQTLRLSAAEVALAKEKVISAGVRNAIADERGRNAALTKEVSEAYRSIENEKAKAAQGVADAVLKEKRGTAAAVAAALADAADRANALSLRNQLADFVAGRGGPSGSAADAGAGFSAEERATSIGLVLATCADTSIADAGELEDQASQIRGHQAYEAVINGVWSAGEHK